MEEVRGSIPLSSTNNTWSRTISEGLFDRCFWWGTSGGTYTIREFASVEPVRFRVMPGQRGASDGGSVDLFHVLE